MKFPIESNVEVISPQADWLRKYGDTIRAMSDGDSFFIENGTIFDMTYAMHGGRTLGKRVHAVQLETDPVTGLPGVRAWVKSIGWDEWFHAEKVDTSPAVPTDPIYYYMVDDGQMIESGVKQNYTTYHEVTKEKFTSLVKSKSEIAEHLPSKRFFMNGDNAVALDSNRTERFMARNPDAYDIRELDYLMVATGHQHANGSWIKGKPLQINHERLTMLTDDIWVGVGGVTWGQSPDGAVHEYALSTPFPADNVRLSYVAYLRQLLLACVQKM